MPSSPPPPPVGSWDGRPSSPPDPASDVQRRQRRSRRVRWVVLGGGAILLAAAVIYFVGFSSSTDIFSGLHDRADRIESNPPAGLTLERRSDEGSSFCPFECGGAYTTMVYSGSGVDGAHLCSLGEAKLTELFGEPTTARTAANGGCGPTNWRLPGVYHDFAYADLRVMPAHDLGLPADGPVLVITVNSGRA